MKVPLSWLQTHIPLNLAPAQIAHLLTSLGIEVEKIHNANPTFSGVVVGKVLEVTPHPGADKLQLATVTDGKETFEIVCGAPNCRKGLVTAFAKIGASLTDESGKPFLIKKSKIRGVESHGMLCSAQELHLSSEQAAIPAKSALGKVPEPEAGMAAEQDGILEFPSETPLGIDPASFLLDPLFEISLTPNLGHALSIRGIARELSAALEIPLSQLSSSPTNALPPSQRKLQLENPELCPFYACQEIQGVRVAPSPPWLRAHLESCGARSINNVVDILNFVMLECGQPLHAFDRDRIQGTLRIRANHGTTPCQTLDGKEVLLPPGTLLIADDEKVLAIAGIMGCLSSAVQDSTQNLLLEAAQFSPTSIRKSSKALGIATDSSYRFERGIDAGATLSALHRATSLILEIAGGTPLAPTVQGKPPSQTQIPYRPSRINALLGLTLSENEITSFLQRLQISSIPLGPDSFQATIPSYRNDLKMEADLAEEVARIFGLANFPTVSAKVTISPLADSPLYTLEQKVRSFCLGQGLQETLTCDLISPFLSKLAVEHGLKEESFIHVLHPSSLDQSILRASLLPTLLQVVQHNFNHGSKDLALFEIGKVHCKVAEDFTEQTTLGIVLTGNRRPWHWDKKPEPFDFFDLKGILESLLPFVSFEPSHFHSLHPFRQATIQLGKKSLGVLGAVHPKVLHSLDLREDVFFAELNLNDLLPLQKKEKKCAPLAQFPSSSRDWTLPLKESVPVRQVLGFIESFKSPLLEDVQVLDLFSKEGKKNTTLRFTYRDPKQTLSFETVEQEHTKLTQRVAEKLRDCLI